MTLISVGGRFAPRRLFRGFDVRAAQSSGEWPGSKITGRDERCGLPGRGRTGRVLVVRRDPGGTRREAAAEGGGRREALGEARGAGGGGGGGINDVLVDVERHCSCASITGAGGSNVIVGDGGT